MSGVLLREQQADKEIIASLIRTTHTLWNELEAVRSVLELQQVNKQRIVMSKVMQDLQGAYYLVEEYEQLTEEVAKEIEAHAEHDLTMVRNFFAKGTGNVPAETVSETPGTPAQPEQSAAEPTPAPTISAEPSPAPVDQAQPVDQSQETPAAPVEQPAAPAEAVAQTTADPNQAQPQVNQPDPNSLPPLQ